MSHKADLVSIYMCEDIKDILSGRIIFEPVAAGIIIVSACDQGIDSYKPAEKPMFPA